MQTQINNNQIDLIETFSINQWGQQEDWFTFLFTNDPYSEPNWYFKSKESLLKYLETNTCYPKSGFYN